MVSFRLNLQVGFVQKMKLSIGDTLICIKNQRQKPTLFVGDQGVLKKEKSERQRHSLEQGSGGVGCHHHHREHRETQRECGHEEHKLQLCELCELCGKNLRTQSEMKPPQDNLSAFQI